MRKRTALGMMGAVMTVIAAPSAIARPPEQQMWTLQATLGSSASNLVDIRKPVQSPLANIAGLAGRSGVDGIFRCTAVADIGAFSLAVSADRTKSVKSQLFQPMGLNRWSLRGMGVSAAVGLSEDITLVAEGAYARMKRRLSVVDDVPMRLSTKIARVGLGLVFGESNRLLLDYVRWAGRRGGTAISTWPKRWVARR
jgi:hypothetical protein